MKAGSRLVQFPLNHPRLITILMTIFTLALGSLMVKVHVDTDPENMLSEHEEVRVFHNQVKKEFNLHDMVVLGVVNENHPQGVFNPATLNNVHELTEFAKTLSSAKHPEHKVISRDIMAAGNVDTIIQAGLGQVRFEWLMATPPTTDKEALAIRDRAMNNPMLKGTLVSEDEKAMGIYIPVSSKDFANEVRQRLLTRIKTLDGDDDFFITGLPVAEDTFGKEMFVQMAISAPLAMLAIFILMLLFFRKVRLIISPMIVAMVSVIATMGLLIGTGNTLHIMSSMIPIFLMPIAVVDSIHILSEFFDQYQKTRNRRQTIEHVMDQLFMPMLYTSLTSSSGFASLALTPIPPVQAFGIFVAFGIMLAWLVTTIFIPAYIMMMKEDQLTGFGMENEDDQGRMSALLSKLGLFTYKRARLILAATMVMIGVSWYGINQITVNDNPMNWFTENHPIREADRALNSHFGGTYEAYLVLEAHEEKIPATLLATMLHRQLDQLAGNEHDRKVIKEARLIIDQALEGPAGNFLDNIGNGWLEKMDASDDLAYEVWTDTLDMLTRFQDRKQAFKDPQLLNYLSRLQDHLASSGLVGKSNSVTDVVKKVHQELFTGDDEHYRVPDSRNAVAQCLMSFQNSHKPEDLWHLVTPDYKKANIWLQLKNGDNQLMQEVVDQVDDFLRQNPPPIKLEHRWAGLTYLNIVWQDKMVNGMMDAFLSSFIVVFVMMVILFRSVIWGMLAMIPLSVTIALIYGIIGIIGKDYDMPVAVLSSLTLGLAVDFAIHFLERSRVTFNKTGSWQEATKEMFAEPARAISRNVVVIAVGFTPLLAAPLVPYKTVGVFLASIMAISGFGTMLILPSAITVLQNFLFKKR